MQNSTEGSPLQGKLKEHAAAIRRAIRELIREPPDPARVGLRGAQAMKTKTRPEERSWR